MIKQRCSTVLRTTATASWLLKHTRRQCETRAELAGESTNNYRWRSRLERSRATVGPGSAGTAPAALAWPWQMAPVTSMFVQRRALRGGCWPHLGPSDFGPSACDPTLDQPRKAPIPQRRAQRMRLHIETCCVPRLLCDVGAHDAWCVRRIARPAARRLGEDSRTAPLDGELVAECARRWLPRVDEAMQAASARWLLGGVRPGRGKRSRAARTRTIAAVAPDRRVFESSRCCCALLLRGFPSSTVVPMRADKSIASGTFERRERRESGKRADVSGA